MQRSDDQKAHALCFLSLLLNSLLRGRLAGSMQAFKNELRKAQCLLIFRELEVVDTEQNFGEPIVAGMLTIAYAANFGSHF